MPVISREEKKAAELAAMKEKAENEEMLKDLVLCIIGQPVEKLAGLSYCPRLKELWAAECQIQKIEGMEQLQFLKKLYLYSNNISKLQNVENLTDLEIFWINDNNIPALENIETLKNLRELNVAQNRITKIGNALHGLLLLEKLELSGNLLVSLKDLTQLGKLPNLTELGLKCPSYSSCPVSQLCNYSTHILYHLPRLLRLDSMDVSSKQVAELAEMTVAKKKMFYNMKVKTLQRNLASMKNKTYAIEKSYRRPYLQRLQTLHKALKDLAREFPPSEKGEEASDSSDQLRFKRAALCDRVKKWEDLCSKLASQCKETLQRLDQSCEVSLQRLQLELDTGGNVRLEDGTPSDPWFKAVHDLILSRFCAADYRAHGVVGIRLRKVSRLHNRALRMRFEDALNQLVEEDDNYQNPTKNSNYKKFIEYLFWEREEPYVDSAQEPTTIWEDGFPDGDGYLRRDLDPAVPLTNSIYLAEERRIAHLIRQRRGGKDSGEIGRASCRERVYAPV